MHRRFLRLAKMEHRTADAARTPFGAWMQDSLADASHAAAQALGVTIDTPEGQCLAATDWERLAVAQQADLTARTSRRG